jgi:hypothetical protein
MARSSGVFRGERPKVEQMSLGIGCCPSNSRPIARYTGRSARFLVFKCRRNAKICILFCILGVGNIKQINQERGLAP